MSDIIAVSLFDSKTRDISSEPIKELLQYQKSTKLILKPESYNEFINTMISTFNLQKNSNIKIYNFYNKEKNQILNESDYSSKNNNSIYLLFEFPEIKDVKKENIEVVKKKENENDEEIFKEDVTNFFTDFDFTKDLKTDSNDLEKIISSLDIQKPNNDDNIRRANTIKDKNESFISQIDEIHNSLLSSFISDIKKINEDNNAQFQRFPSMTLPSVLGSIQKIKDNFQKKAENLLAQRNCCISAIKENNNKLKAVNKNMEKYDENGGKGIELSIIGKDDNGNNIDEDEIEDSHNLEKKKKNYSENTDNENLEIETKSLIKLKIDIETPKGDDEINEQGKPIFIFENEEENIISKTIKEANVIDFENIKIKNISRNSYNSSNLLWIKENNSDADIYFYSSNKGPSEELSFEENNNIIENKTINKNIKLTIKNPKENIYKIYISLMNKITKKKLTEKSLKISVKLIKDKNEEKTKKIISDLKMTYSKEASLINDDEITNVIKEKNFEEEPVIKWFDEKVKETEKKLIQKLNDELKISDFMNEEAIKEKIKKYNYDEEKIKSSINEEKTKKKENAIDENKIQELIKYLDEEFTASAFIKEDEIREKIIEVNGDKEQLRNWVEDQV